MVRAKTSTGAILKSSVFLGIGGSAKTLVYETKTYVFKMLKGWHKNSLYI